MKILVLGDIIVDVYTYGRVDRLSPDFTGFVFDKSERQEIFLGGAANVARGIKSLMPQSEVWLMGSIGPEYDYLFKGLNLIRVSEESMIKERIVAEADTAPGRPRAQQKLIRIDTLKKFSKSINDVPGDEWNYVVLSDYDKGTIPIGFKPPKCVASFMDSKRKDVSSFAHIDILKINSTEYEKCKDSIKNKVCIVTHGPYPSNIYIQSRLEGTVQTHNVESNNSQLDYCGAGDSFLAGLIYAYKGNSFMDLHHAVMTANRVAGIAITKFGTKSVSNTELNDSYSNEIN